jgi:hypothetical protein
MLTEEEKENILMTFPNIKLSYEKIIHKKVSNFDLILAIPDGTKCFAWFTTLNDKCVCILFELESTITKKIKNIKIVTTCFSSSLSYGTIIYGTLFNHSKNSFFCIEDIFLYKGINISGENWKNKFNQILTMFTNDIKQISYNNSFLVFGLPIMVKTNEELFDIISKSLIKYKLHSIQYRQLNNINSYLIISLDKFLAPIENHIEYNQRKIQKYENSSNNIIFGIKPDIQNDVYHLYCDKNEYYGIACIPDFKTSVMMNKLFRIIKENDDLDKLEESDDEDEFENPNIDKFVNLDKFYKFECQFNKRFKKWVPYKLLDDKANLSKMIDIKNAVNKLLTKPIKNYK